MSERRLPVSSDTCLCVFPCLCAVAPLLLLRCAWPLPCHCAVLCWPTQPLPHLHTSVTDYVKSLMLFEVLYPPRGVATLPDEIIPQTTQFWTSNIVEALIHIHNQGVAYRDLKPENLLVNEQVSARDSNVV